MGVVGNRGHQRLYNDIGRIGGETDSATGGIAVHTLDSRIHLLRHLGGHTLEFGLIFRIVESVYPKGRTSDVVEAKPFRLDRGGDYEVFI